MPNQIDPGISKPAAAAIASAALWAPLALSASSTPSPNHPRIFFWYWLLRKPKITPPNWVFPVVWSGIDAALAGAGYRLLRSSPGRARTGALGLWAWNVLMIGVWNRIFFKNRSLAASAVAAASLAATSVMLVKKSASVDRAAAKAELPLAAWVGFATVLAATIWAMNRRRR